MATVDLVKFILNMANWGLCLTQSKQYNLILRSSRMTPSVGQFLFRNTVIRIANILYLLKFLPEDMKSTVYIIRINELMLKRINELF